MQCSSKATFEISVPLNLSIQNARSALQLYRCAASMTENNRETAASGLGLTGIKKNRCAGAHLLKPTGKNQEYWRIRITAWGRETNLTARRIALGNCLATVWISRTFRIVSIAKPVQLPVLGVARPPRRIQRFSQQWREMYWRKRPYSKKKESQSILILPGHDCYRARWLGSSAALPRSHRSVPNP